MRYEARTADIVSGQQTTTCPFCRIPTAFQFSYNGMIAEYRSKCTHVASVTRKHGPVVVEYQCFADGSSR